MSWPALGWAAKQKPGKVSDKMVLIALSDRYNDEDDMAWPSVAWLSDFCCLDRKTVIACLSRLEVAGFIADTGKRAGKTRRVKCYSLNINNEANSTTKGIPETGLLDGKSTTIPPKEYQKRYTEPVIEPSSEAKASSDNKPPKSKSKIVAKPNGVSGEVWNDFVDHRKIMKAPVSQTAINGIAREADRAGWPLEDALAECVMRGWKGFKSGWVKENDENNRNGKSGGGNNEKTGSVTESAVAGAKARLASIRSESPSGDRGSDVQRIGKMPDPVRSLGYVER